MNDRATTAIPLADVISSLKSPKSSKSRATPKGRQVDPTARLDVAALLAGRVPRRDHLIEYLHLLQDRYGHLAAAHLAALAELMKLAQAEVYEVATFYHHFDVVKEGEAPPPAITVRVCETLSCAMAGGNDLLEKLPEIVGEAVRVVAVPCIGRCAEAPAVCVGQHAFGHATVEKVFSAITLQEAADLVTEVLN